MNTRRRKQNRKTRKQRGGARKVRVSNGRIGIFYGINRATKKTVVDFGNGKEVLFNAANVEFLDPSAPSKAHEACAMCGRVPTKIPEQEYLNGTNLNVFKARTLGAVLIGQDDFTIVKKDAKVGTLGVATCSAVQFTFGPAKFFAHISSMTELDKMFSTVKALAEKLKVSLKDATDVRIWAGIGGSSNDNYILNDPSFSSLQNIHKLLRALEIPVPAEVIPVCFMEAVGLTDEAQAR